MASILGPLFKSKQKTPADLVRSSLEALETLQRKKDQKSLEKVKPMTMEFTFCRQLKK